MGIVRCNKCNSEMEGVLIDAKYYMGCTWCGFVRPQCEADIVKLTGRF